MRFKPFTFAVALTVTWAVASANAQDGKVEPAVNAALKYWQAFALLPSLDKEQEKLLQDWNTTPLTDAAQKLIQASRASRRHLHRAAEIDHCDWSLDRSEGIQLPMPHLAKARTLARLTGLHARDAFERGKWHEGVQDVAALLVLSRHVEQDSFLISLAVRYGIEAMAIETVARNLPNLDAAALKLLAEKMDHLPRGGSVQSELKIEKKYMYASVLKAVRQAEKESSGSWRGALIAMADAASRPTIEKIDTYATALKLLDEVGPLYERQAELAGLPPGQYEAQSASFLQKATLDNPLAGLLLPALDSMLVRERKSQVQLAQLQAALAVLQGGKKKLKEVCDPFGDGPFEYVPRTGGFELRSRLRIREQPVLLVVGK